MESYVYGDLRKELRIDFFLVRFKTALWESLTNESCH